MVVEVGTCEEEAMIAEDTIATTGHPTFRLAEEATVAGTVADLGATHPTSNEIHNNADGSCPTKVGSETELSGRSHTEIFLSAVG